MQITFDSLDEVLEFANQYRVRTAPEGVISPRHIDPVQLANDIASVAKIRNKICAIRLFRAATGWGLKDSKEMIERYWPNFL